MLVSKENPWGNVVCVGVDNTNVNIGRHNSIKSRLAENETNVYVQGCPCHIFHNTAKKGAKAVADKVNL